MCVHVCVRACVCLCVNVLTLLSCSLAAEKNHVLCFLLKWTILKGNTLLDVVSSAALITLWVRHFSVLLKNIHVKTEQFKAHSEYYSNSIMERKSEHL